MEALDSFGEWLRHRREALALTRPELAECVGCSVSALRKIEADERRPSRQLAELLAGCLRISPEEQPAFVDAALGVRLVARLGWPAPPAIPRPLPPAPGSPDTVPSPKPTEPARNLPAPATPLIGREAELATLAQLLADPACRLLTLAGPGGIGKTRLAIEAACGECAHFADGIFFAPLASIGSGEYLVPAVAQTVGLNFYGQAEPRVQLLHFLSGKQLLLLLDNMEHLLEGVDFLAELLVTSPGLKLLVTSRERLELSGEWIFEVQGLPVPGEGQVEALERSSAVQLFLQRAQQARVDFEVATGEWPDIARICRLVEGMPLALELAATWVPVLSCAEIADEIERDLDILTARLRDVPVRQRSLRAVFDHSWQLLSEDERMVLRQLAVFHGGFTREAGEAIAGATLPLLSTLVAKSLVRRAANGRCDLHHLVRQFVLVHMLTDGDSKTKVADRHCRFYLALLHEREGGLKSAGQEETLRELTAEIDNVRTAWAWAVERRIVDAIAPAVRAVGYLCELAGWLGEGVGLLERAVQCGEAHLDEPAWRRIVGEAMGQQGLLLFRRGEFEQAKARLCRSLALLRPFDDPRLMAPPLLYYGVITQLDGDLDQGEGFVEEALACARSAGARWYEAYAVYCLGFIASQRGQYHDGYQYMSDGIALWRAIGDPRAIALGQNFLGPTLIQLGYYAEAEISAQESLALCLQAADRWGMGTAYRSLGAAALAQGDIVTARRQLTKSIETFKGFSTGWDIARSLIYLGQADHAAGDLEQARCTLQDALAEALAAHAVPLALAALLALADLDLDCGAHSAALRLAAFVAEHSAAMHETRTRAGDLYDAAVAQFDREQVRAAREWAAGQSLETIALECLGSRTSDEIVEEVILGQDDMSF